MTIKLAWVNLVYIHLRDRLITVHVEITNVNVYVSDIEVIVVEIPSSLILRINCKQFRAWTRIQLRTTIVDFFVVVWPWASSIYDSTELQRISLSRKCKAYLLQQFDQLILRYSSS